MLPLENVSFTRGWMLVLDNHLEGCRQSMAHSLATHDKRAPKNFQLSELALSLEYTDIPLPVIMCNGGSN